MNRKHRQYEFLKQKEAGNIHPDCGWTQSAASLSAETFLAKANTLGAETSLSFSASLSKIKTRHTTVLQCSMLYSPQQMFSCRHQGSDDVTRTSSGKQHHCHPAISFFKLLFRDKEMLKEQFNLLVNNCPLQITKINLNPQMGEILIFSTASSIAIRPNV